jgi:hypothetical protein
MRTIQGDDPAARERLQLYADDPISRQNNERMHAVARQVLAGQWEPESAPATDPGADAHDSASAMATPSDLELSE